MSRIIYFFVAVFTLITSIYFILTFFGVIPSIFKESVKNISLSIVGFDDPSYLSPIIKSYEEKNPGVKITYYQVFNDLEEEFINDLAEGKAADIYYFKDSWLQKHYAKISPISKDILNINSFSTLFPTIARQDFTSGETIFALPLFIDTLALIYNKEIFDESGITSPPKNWLEFQKDAIILRKVDSKKNIIRNAFAIGGIRENTLNSKSILNTLLLQSGVRLINSDFSITNIANDSIPAYNFYFSFSDKNNSNYSFNSNTEPIRLLADKKLAGLFGYYEDYKKISATYPFIDLGITPIPQPIIADPQVTVANYYGLTVTATSKNKDEAWKFIIFATTNEEENSKYLKLAQRPPALRNIIESLKDAPILGVYARQALIARNYFRINEDKESLYLDKSIKDIYEGKRSIEESTRELESNLVNLKNSQGY